MSTTDIHVVFRVNLTKLNDHEYVFLHKYLMERFKTIKHKGILPAFVMDRGCSICREDDNSIFFNPDDVAHFVMKLYNKYKIHSSFLHYPSNFFNECAIRNRIAVSFDPEGYAYKCWEVIGNKEYAIGKLDDTGRLSAINEVVLNRQLYGADTIDDSTCSTCRYLPICHGGYPIQRIENMFEGKKNCCCTFWKGHLPELLKIHLKLKKEGFKNGSE